MYLSFLLVENLEESLHVAKTLNLKSFQNHVTGKYLKSFVRGRISKRNLEVLRIAEKNDLFEYMKQRFDSDFGKVLEAFQLVRDPSFKVLSRETRYEILKGSILFPFKYYADRPDWQSPRPNLERNVEWLELTFIMNFLDLVVYEDRTAEMTCRTNGFRFKTIPKYLEKLEESFDLVSISCDKRSSDCVTLAVEDKEIYVSSFLLTNNSPVFKAMLSSNSFKEGQNKRIELPGKKFNQIAYFVQYLHSPKEIGNEQCKFKFYI